MNILNQRNWGDESHKVHFESGVRMGIGTFNLVSMILTKPLVFFPVCFGNVDANYNAEALLLRKK
jgi:hypothetical protein